MLSASNTVLPPRRCARCTRGRHVRLAAPGAVFRCGPTARRGAVCRAHTTTWFSCCTPAGCRRATYRRRRVAAVSDRVIAFEQVFNFRDLGGYPARGGTLRWRTLFRADGLNRLQPGEEEAFGALGISTVIDLRTGEEADHGGRFPTDVWDVSYHHLPMFDVLP